MRRGKHALRAMAGLGIATLAVASAITAVQTVGPEGGATAYGAPASQGEGGPVRPSAPLRPCRSRSSPTSGQTDPRVRYYARRQPLRVLRDPRRADALADEGQAGLATGAGTALPRPRPRTRRPPAPSGRRARSTTCAARARRTWQTELTRYQDIVYRDLWPNIDLRAASKAGSLKYEFHVRPGAPRRGHPPRVRRARPAALDAEGRAAHRDRASACCATRAPVSYQRIAGKRVAVASRYVLDAAARRRASRSPSGAYRHDRELVIDPGIQFTTFLGGGSQRDRRRHRRRRRRQLLHRGHDAVARLPDDPGAFRRTGSAQQLRGRVRDEAEPRRHGARLLDVRRRQQPGVRQRHRDRRRGQRLRHRHDEVVELPDLGERVRPHRSTSRRTARAAAPTTPTASSSSSTRVARRSPTPPTSEAPTSSRRAASRWTGRAAPTSSARSWGATSRPRRARSGAPARASTTCS